MSHDVAPGATAVTLTEQADWALLSRRPASLALGIHECTYDSRLPLMEEIYRERNVTNMLKLVPAAGLRRSQREPEAVPIDLVLQTEFVQTDAKASTVDVSLRGACVRTVFELSPGQRVGVVAKNRFPNAIPGRVVWARRDESGHGFLAGLEFVLNLPTYLEDVLDCEAA